jgi:hypothetical protein
LTTLIDAAIIITITLIILIGSQPEAEAPPPSLPSGIPESSAALQSFRPLLQRASTQADALVALGQARERNLIRIRSEQNAMAAVLAEADAWVNANSDSESEPAIATYGEGAASIRAVMNEAQEGFLRFDFDRVTGATETLMTGADALRQALDLLTGA